MDKDQYKRKYGNENAVSNLNNTALNQKKDINYSELQDIKSQINQAKISITNLKQDNNSMNMYLSKKVLGADNNMKVNENYSIGSPLEAQSPKLLMNSNIGQKNTLENESLLTNYKISSELSYLNQNANMNHRENTRPAKNNDNSRLGFINQRNMNIPNVDLVSPTRSDSDYQVNRLSNFVESTNNNSLQNNTENLLEDNRKLFESRINTYTKDVTPMSESICLGIKENPRTELTCLKIQNLVATFMDRIHERKPLKECFFDYFPTNEPFEQMIKEKNYAETLLKMMKTILDYLTLININSPLALSGTFKKGQIKMNNSKLIKSESTEPKEAKKSEDFSKKHIAIEYESNKKNKVKQNFHTQKSHELTQKEDITNLNKSFEPNKKALNSLKQTKNDNSKKQLSFDSINHVVNRNNYESTKNVVKKEKIKEEKPINNFKKAKETNIRKSKVSLKLEKDNSRSKNQDLEPNLSSIQMKNSVEIPKKEQIKDLNSLKLDEDFFTNKSPALESVIPTVSPYKRQSATLKNITISKTESNVQVTAGKKTPQKVMDMTVSNDNCENNLSIVKTISVSQKFNFDEEAINNMNELRSESSLSKQCLSKVNKSLNLKHSIDIIPEKTKTSYSITNSRNTIMSNIKNNLDTQSRAENEENLESNNSNQDLSRNKRSNSDMWLHNVFKKEKEDSSNVKQNEFIEIKDSSCDKQNLDSAIKTGKTRNANNSVKRTSLIHKNRKSSKGLSKDQKKEDLFVNTKAYSERKIRTSDRNLATKPVKKSIRKQILFQDTPDKSKNNQNQTKNSQRKNFENKQIETLNTQNLDYLSNNKNNYTSIGHRNRLIDDLEEKMQFIQNEEKLVGSQYDINTEIKRDFLTEKRLSENSKTSMNNFSSIMKDSLPIGDPKYLDTELTLSKQNSVEKSLVNRSSSKKLDTFLFKQNLEKLEELNYKNSSPNYNTRKQSNNSLANELELNDDDKPALQSFDQNALDNDDQISNSRRNTYISKIFGPPSHSLLFNNRPSSSEQLISKHLDNNMTKTMPKVIPGTSAKKVNLKRKKSANENSKSSQNFLNNKTKERSSYNNKIRNYNSEKVPTSRSHNNLEIMKQTNQKHSTKYSPTIDTKAKKTNPSLLSNRSASAKDMLKIQNTNSAKSNFTSNKALDKKSGYRSINNSICNLPPKFDHNATKQIKTIRNQVSQSSVNNTVDEINESKVAISNHSQVMARNSKNRQNTSNQMPKSENKYSFRSQISKQPVTNLSLDVKEKFDIKNNVPNMTAPNASDGFSTKKPNTKRESLKTKMSENVKNKYFSNTTAKKGEDINDESKIRKLNFNINSKTEEDSEKQINKVKRFFNNILQNDPKKYTNNKLMQDSLKNIELTERSYNDEAVYDAEIENQTDLQERYCSLNKD